MTQKQTVLAMVTAVGISCFGAQAIAQGPPPPPSYYGGQASEWDASPNEYQQEAQHKGFHEGIEGARKDFENHRSPDVENRDEYRHPDVSHSERRAYRDAFRRGYQTGVDRLMHDRDRDHD